MFRVSTIEVLEETQIILVPEILEDDSSLFEGTVSPVEGASDLMDPPLFFMFYWDLSPALTMFMLLHLWI